jgi:hypothetical protein
MSDNSSPFSPRKRKFFITDDAIQEMIKHVSINNESIMRVDKEHRDIITYYIEKIYAYCACLEKSDRKSINSPSHTIVIGTIEYIINFRFKNGILPIETINAIQELIPNGILYLAAKENDIVFSFYIKRSTLLNTNENQ